LLSFLRVRCPHCREYIPRAASACPRCARPTRSEDGQLIKALDLDFEVTLRDLDVNARRWLGRGTIIIFCLSFLGFTPLFPLIPFAMILVYALIARLFIGRSYDMHYETSRRIITRWTARSAVLATSPLFLAFGVMPHAPFTAAPTAATLLGGAWVYHRWHLKRAHHNEPVHPIEKGLLVLVGVLGLVAIAIITFFIVAVVSLWDGLGLG